MPVVLVTGGSGYLGQFLVQALTKPADNTVVFTFHSRPPSEAELAALGNPVAVKADLRTGQGLDDCRTAAGGALPDVVINCAAMSIPRDCEADPEGARALNVPRALLSWLEANTASAANWSSGAIRPPLLIHLSTDQVYDGSREFNREDGPAQQPVNTYGRTKLEAEEEIARAWGNYAILRSSIIVGPPAPAIGLPKTPPLVWMDKALASGHPSTFFHDEFRCPVFVHDLVAACERLIKLAQKGTRLKLLLNAGGPDRLSRAGMAEVLAQVRRYAQATPEDVARGAVAITTFKAVGGDEQQPRPLSELIIRVPASSAVNRGVASPLDISMDTTKIVALLDITLTPFADAVKQSFIPPYS